MAKPLKKLYEIDGQWVDRNADDMTVVLMSGTYLAQALEDAIKVKFLSLTPKQSVELFSNRGPLQTFGDRISVAYALGIIGETAATELRLIKEIRNAFAHGGVPISFETPEIASECLKLRTIDRFPNLKMTDWFGQLEQVGGSLAKSIFFYSSHYLWLGLYLWNQFNGEEEEYEGTVTGLVLQPRAWSAEKTDYLKFKTANNLL